MGHCSKHAITIFTLSKGQLLRVITCPNWVHTFTNIIYYNFLLKPSFGRSSCPTPTHHSTDKQSWLQFCFHVTLVLKWPSREQKWKGTNEAANNCKYFLSKWSAAVFFHKLTLKNSFPSPWYCSMKLLSPFSLMLSALSWFSDFLNRSISYLKKSFSPTDSVKQSNQH